MPEAGQYSNGYDAGHKWQADGFSGTTPSRNALPYQTTGADDRAYGSEAADRTAPRFSEQDVERILGTALNRSRAMAGGAPAVANPPLRVRIGSVARWLNRIGSYVWFWSGLIVCCATLGWLAVAGLVELAK